MKISFDWLKTYLPLDMTPEETAGILTAIGLEVGKIERYESIRGGLRGVVAGHVRECVKHPNADRLSLCKVDTGKNALLQIVCGAPNVEAGQKVWVAQVGTTLYPRDAEDGMKIDKVKVRGEYSEGMICAEDELGLGDDHSGIMVLPDDIAVGTEASAYYDVIEDYVIEIDLTPNRSDATSHLGVAEDLAAYLSTHGHTAVVAEWPKPDVAFPESAGTPVKVEVENHEACPRYAGVVIDDITVQESPSWLRRRLEAVGVRPINNVVDVTNFVLHEMGQPLHAFDADKIAGSHIVVRTLPEGTRFTTLDEIERKLTSRDLMICDGNGEGMCIAGVYGGVGTGVTEGTTRIFLESAHFHPEWIRRTSMYHLLRTDAARTFEKTTDPNVCVKAVYRAAQLLTEVAGARVASALTDIYPEPIKPKRVDVRWNRVRDLTGVKIGKEEMLNILKALNMDIEDQDEEKVRVAVPTNKADVEREADVTEEILRIYGYDNVPFKMQITSAVHPVMRPARYQLRQILGAFLSSLGFSEMMGLSMTEEKYFEEGPLAMTRDARVIIENTSNTLLNLMRPNLLISALETARHNQSRNQDSFRLYEFGNAYGRSGEEMSEEEQLTLIITGDEFPPNWRSGEQTGADYYVLKKYVDAVLERVSLTAFETEELDTPLFAYGMRYTWEDRQVVDFGLLADDLCVQFDLRGDHYYACFKVDALFDAFRSQDLRFTEISKFPAIRRDLAFDLPRAVSFERLAGVISGTAGTEMLQSVELFDIYENKEVLGEDRKSYAVQLLFENPARTLTDAEVDKVLEGVIARVSSQLGGKLRG